MDRRVFFSSAIGVAASVMIGSQYRKSWADSPIKNNSQGERMVAMSDTPLQAPGFEELSSEDWMSISNKEWKQRLGAEAFNVLRKEGTERPFTSALNDEKRDGWYACSGCGLVLFESNKKFDSGTGWPSFFDFIEERLGFKTDYKLLYPRKEYHCARCGGHQGHVFKDGPKPTGLRYCNNGVALTFVPRKSKV